MQLENRIILIGGSAGVGKTTLAKEISHSMNIIHRLGTGFIREVLRSHLDKQTHPSLFTYTFRPNPGDDLEENYREQSKIICKSVNAVIERALNEGTSVVIEGNHLLPEYLILENVTLFAILTCSDKMLAKRIFGNTHNKRSIYPEDIQNAIALQNIISKSAAIYNIPIIQNDNLQTTMIKIGELCNT